MTKSATPRGFDARNPIVLPTAIPPLSRESFEPSDPSQSKKKPLLVADLFCGSGGFSTGASRAIRALGGEMRLTCVNYWDVAIESHRRNHPDARHYCQDLAAVRPIAAVPEGHLDLLLASPSCTNHSRARGGRPTSDQQRMDPWHVITWLSELRVSRLIIENVPEFVEWGPVNRVTGRPIKSRKGEYFRAWIEAIRSHGFNRLGYRVLNCADYGDATTRQRFFLIARSDRKTLSWPIPTHSRSGEQDLFGAGALKWRSAAEIIDWNKPGRSIYARTRPLSPKTLLRTYSGVVRYGWHPGYAARLEAHMLEQGVTQDDISAVHRRAARLRIVKPDTCPAANDRPEHALVIGKQSNAEPRDAGAPIPTITTQGRRKSLVTNESLVDTSLMMPKHSASLPRPTGTPVPTIVSTACGGIGLLTQSPPPEAMLLQKQTKTEPRPTEQPMPTIATKSGIGLITAASAPFIATVAHGTISTDDHCRRTRSMEHPIPTIHAGGGAFSLITAGHGTTEGNEQAMVLGQQSGATARLASSPLPTVSTTGAIGLIAPYYGDGSGKTALETEQPLPTVTTKGRFALATPPSDDPDATGRGLGTTDREGIIVQITHTGIEHRVRSSAEPIATITGANRGEMAFISAKGHGGQNVRRVHRIKSGGGQAAAPALLSGDRSAGPDNNFDILFRMLEVRELAAATSLNEPGQPYVLSGNKTEQIKQIGNAVPSKTAEALIRAMLG